MMATYAKIDASISPHVIVDLTIASSGDTFDPAFNWTDITAYNPIPQIGWTTTDDVTFIHPGLAYDAYGFSVTMVTAGGFDIYSSASGFKAKVVAGTSATPAYISLAIQQNISIMMNAANAFVDSRYSQNVRINLQGLIWSCLTFSTILLTVTIGLPNRLNYLLPLQTWQAAIFSYIQTYVATVQAMTNPATIVATVADFSQFLPGGANPDPLITPLGAIVIIT